MDSDILKEAFAKDLFVLYYQPKINLHTKKVESAEALIRIECEDGKIIYPNDFIPLAEKNNQIVDIDRWVFKQLIEDSRYISMMTQDSISISFNVSTSSFLEDDFLQNLSEIFNFTTDFNSIFEIELIEYSLIQDVEKSIQKMVKLKEMGFKLSLDDFGTGYASLSYLRDFPIDCIKIDKSFIDKLEIDDKTTKIIESIIYLAKRLDMKTVAEGVEETTQVVWLHEHNCDEIQGYYYSKPLPIAKFTKFVKAINQRDRENSFIAWGEKYSVGNYAFDTQHMIIASILNNLYKEIKENKHISDVSDYFELLDRYIEVHFEAEEKYMKDTNYKDIKAHIKAHNDFKKIFKDFKSSNASNREDSIKLFKILKEWLVSHELVFDKLFLKG
jgi:hemerythrin-like metal-binding protein